jgi:hypothetical protein
LLHIHGKSLSPSQGSVGTNVITARECNTCTRIRYPAPVLEDPSCRKGREKNTLFSMNCLEKFENDFFLGIYFSCCLVSNSDINNTFLGSRCMKVWRHPLQQSKEHRHQTRHRGPTYLERRRVYHLLQSNFHTHNRAVSLRGFSTKESNRTEMRKREGGSNMSP